jgi:hypothetical protein
VGSAQPPRALVACVAVVSDSQRTRSSRARLGCCRFAVEPVALAAEAIALCAALAIAALAGSTASAAAANTAGHFACSGKNSVKVSCHFSTPSGNIRCLWTPKPNSVACELLATGRGYRLNPTGKAKSIHLHLTKRGETLPTSQDIVFPESLSCHDTKTTITCNQDFGSGFFKLASKGSKSA